MKNAFVLRHLICYHNVMLIKIKNKIEKELSRVVENINKTTSLKKASPLLYRAIKSFILRPGKRIRPTLFIAGYLGFAKKPAPNLYTSAISIELLHDFFLVHDDIIDKSDTRRGKPSMHILFSKHLAKYKNIKFSGVCVSWFCVCVCVFWFCVSWFCVCVFWFCVSWYVFFEIFYHHFVLNHFVLNHFVLDHLRDHLLDHFLPLYI